MDLAPHRLVLNTSNKSIYFLYIAAASFYAASCSQILTSEACYFHMLIDLILLIQVVGAVAFQNRKLAIPQNTSPILTSLMESCWSE